MPANIDFAVSIICVSISKILSHAIVNADHPELIDTIIRKPLTEATTEDVLFRKALV